MDAKRAEIEQPKSPQKMVRAYFSKSSRPAFFLHFRQADLRAASPHFLFLPSPSSPHALAVDFVRVPQQQVPGKGPVALPHRARQLSPTLRSATKHKKSPSHLSKKKTRGKIVLSNRDRNTQCKIKKNSSFIKSSDEMAGLSTPLLRASVRRICAMISITFRPV